MRKLGFDENINKKRLWSAKILGIDTAFVAFLT